MNTMITALRCLSHVSAPRREMACVSLLMALVLAGCSSSRAEVDADVYGACLRDFVGGLGTERRASVLVLCEWTERIEPLSPDGPTAAFALLQRRCPMLRGDTYSAFAASNETAPQKLPMGIRSSLRIRMFSTGDERRLFGAPPPKSFEADPLTLAWRQFHREFPGALGLVRLSKIGYSEDGRQALLYISHGYNSVEGAEFYYVLSRNKTGWQTVERLMARIY